MTEPLPIPALLTLAHWLSAGFPTGAFAYSHGLEAAVRDGQVRDAAGLQDWLAAMLTQGAGRSDAILIRRAASGDDLPGVAALASALQPSSERRTEALAQGAAFAAMVRAVWRFDLPDMALPVAVGRAAALAGLPRDAVVAVYLQGLVLNLTLAAQRLMPLGQTAAQGVVAGLAAAIADLATDSVALTLDDIGSAAFAIDIASMRHEGMEPRLFRS